MRSICKPIGGWKKESIQKNFLKLKRKSHLIKGKFPFNVSQRDVKVAYLVNFSPVTYPTYKKHVHTVYNTYFHQSVKCVLFCVVNNEKKVKTKGNYLLEKTLHSKQKRGFFKINMKWKEDDKMKQ